MEEKYWCDDCCCFVGENHRCQQWDTVFKIPLKALGNSTTEKLCPECDGDGYYGEQPIQTCSSCKGTGSIHDNKAELLKEAIKAIKNAVQCLACRQIGDLDEIIESSYTFLNDFLSRLDKEGV